MTHSLATSIGTLYIVATPIGNRDDITLRALNILKSVDLILAEDTRHSGLLLAALGIKNNLAALHAHNESDKSMIFVDQLLNGKNIALISDAGTPLISDPGFPLVKLARAQNIPVVPIPGACALIAALSAAGVACDSFLFLGFLPAKQNARKTKLESLASHPHTLIFYESTHRILDSLEDMLQIYGVDCQIVLAKELTKTFESIISGTINEIKEWLLTDLARIKGEFVLIIPPRTEVPSSNNDDALLLVLLAELPLKQAVTIASKISTTNKNELYDRALILKG